MIIKAKKLKIKLHFCLSVLISILPFNLLRIFFYRTFLGYKIAMKARIGFGTIIVTNKVEIGVARISRMNKFCGPFDLYIENGAVIGLRNNFQCGWWAIEEKHKNSGYARMCRIGSNALITENHFVDTIGGFEVGEKTWIAGSYSQFWTHGAGATVRLDPALLITALLL